MARPGRWAGAAASSLAPPWRMRGASAQGSRGPSNPRSLVRFRPTGVVGQSPGRWSQPGGRSGLGEGQSGGSSRQPAARPAGRPQLAGVPMGTEATGTLCSPGRVRQAGRGIRPGPDQEARGLGPEPLLPSPPPAPAHPRGRRAARRGAGCSPARGCRPLRSSSEPLHARSAIRTHAAGEAPHRPCRGPRRGWHTWRT